ncbi:MAG: FAD-binding oxidoreductase [Alphaproteobacteria bacterium]
MVPYISYWLGEALAAEGNPAPAPALGEDRRADVCIVGGGFSGLWTALHLKEQRPSLDIVVLEKDICGAGSSGRNGGFCMTWASKLPTVVKMGGAQEGVRLLRASQDAVRAIGRFCRENAIDCHFRDDGWLWTAGHASENGAWNDVLDVLDKLGAQAFERLTPEEVARRAGSRGHVAGVFEAGAATVQPARLNRGLRRVALAKGVRIYENTMMTGLDRGTPPRVRTAKGTITADKVVLALGTWAAALPEFRRTLVPLSADMVVTAPMADSLKAVGLTTGVAISDSSMLVNYYRTTVDGRIVFGRGGGYFIFGGRLGTTFDGPTPRAAEVASELHRYYPSIAKVPLAENWRGPVERTATGLPFFGTLPSNPNIVYGHGYTGNGVGPSYLGGRILASLTLGLDDEWSSCPLAKGPKGQFPPEPFRYVGAVMVKAAIKRKEAAEIAGRRPRALDTYLAGLAPAGLTPLTKKKT